MVKSSKARKQRKAAANASIQNKRKRLRARFATSDSRFAGVRSVAVRVGDTVEVQRGDFGNPSKGKRLGDSRGRAGVEGKVVAIDSSNGKIIVEGVKGSKSDDKEQGIPIHVSNVVVTSLEESDPLRMKKITERS
jgi:large subunit ribosomal protein L24